MRAYVRACVRACMHMTDLSVMRAPGGEGPRGARVEHGDVSAGQPARHPRARRTDTHAADERRRACS